MFEITITETRDVRKTKGRTWGKVGQVEKKRDGMLLCGSGNEPKTYLADEYGFTPEVETIVTETREVLKQNVDSLDLIAVIKAINGIR